MITIRKNGTQISSDIKFTSMTPWNATPKTSTHEIDGADYDIIIYKGLKSATTGINGYCKRTATNLGILNDLKDGSLIEIEHSIDGIRYGIVTALTPQPTAGGGFITFSMTVVEQPNGA